MADKPVQQTVVVQQQPGTSGVAIAGLVFSILGWFTCGLLCIPGALLSFLGLLSRGPKGAAIAGLIVGFPGVIFFFLMGLGMIMTFFGIGAAATSAVAEAEKAASEVAASSETPEDLFGEPEQVDLSGDDKGGTDISSGVTSGGIRIEHIETSHPEPVAPDALQAPDVDREFPAMRDPQPQADTGQVEATAEDTPSATAERASPNRELRTWTDVTGQFTVQAAFHGYGSGQVTLKKEDGSEISVPVEKLSEPDLDYIRDLFKAKGMTPPF